MENRKPVGRPKAVPLPLEGGEVAINAEELRRLKMDSVMLRALKDAGVERQFVWSEAMNIANLEYRLNLM